MVRYSSWETCVAENAEAEEASVNGAESIFNGRVIQENPCERKCGAWDWLFISGRARAIGADFVNDGGGEARIENCCAGGASLRRTEGFSWCVRCRLARTLAIRGQVSPNPMIMSKKSVSEAGLYKNKTGPI